MRFDYTMKDELNNEVRVQAGNTLNPLVWLEVGAETGVLGLTPFQARELAMILTSAAENAESK